MGIVEHDMDEMRERMIKELHKVVELFNEESRDKGYTIVVQPIK